MASAHVPTSGGKRLVVVLLFLLLVALAVLPTKANPRAWGDPLAARTLAGFGSPTSEVAMTTISDEVMLNGTQVLGTYSASGSVPFSAIAPETGGTCTYESRLGNDLAALRKLSSVDADDPCLDYVRLGGIPEDDGTWDPSNITFVPFAEDAVTFVVTSNSSVPRRMTSTELRNIYTCHTPFTPYLPEAGSSVRKIWLDFLEISEVEAGSSPCIVSGQRENDGTSLTTTAVVPYSVANYLSQTRTRSVNSAGKAVLGTVTSTTDPRPALPNYDGYPSGLTFAVTRNSSIPKFFTISDLRKLYTCTYSNPAFTPYLPAPGTIRSTFLAELAISEDDVTAGLYPCIRTTLVDGNVVPENDGRFLNAQSLVPVSISSFLEQETGITLDTRGQAVLGSIGEFFSAPPPIITNRSYDSELVHRIYNAVHKTRLDTSPAKEVFSGPDSLLCERVETIRNAGFLPISDDDVEPCGAAINLPVTHGVVINEIESDGDSANGDWVELYNNSGIAQTIAGAAISDENDAHAFRIPAGTPDLAPDSYVAFRVDDPTEDGEFDLGATDSARLFDADSVNVDGNSTTIVAGAQPIDSFSWSAHASTTYGRLPNGTGSFHMTSPGTFASANPKSTQTSGATTTQTVEAAMSTQFPDGAAEALIVPASDDGLVAEASAFAAAKGIPVVALPTATSGPTLARLTSLHAGSLALYGPTSAFGSAFRTGLADGGVSVTTETLGDSPETRTLAAAETLDKHDELVVFDADASPYVRALAASVAARLGCPMLALPAGSADPAIATHFANQAYTNILQVGSLDGVDTSALAGAETSPTTVTTFDQTVPSDNEREIAELQTGNGNSVRTIFTAPSDQPASMVLSAWESSDHGVFLSGTQSSGDALASTTPAGVWSSLLGEEVFNVHAVGNALPANYALNIVTSGSPRQNPPAFRIKSIMRTATTATAAFSPVPGASSYEAYDVEGTLVGTNSTPTFTLPDGAGALQIVAKNGATDLQVIEFRTNDALAAEGASGVALTSSGDVHVLKWFDNNPTPRLITRQPLDPDDMQAADLTEADPIAITCASSFVDSTNDRTKQWRYVVSTLAGTAGGGCDKSGSRWPASPELTESIVNLPAFEYSQDPSARLMVNAHGASGPHAARPTVVDALLSSSERDGLRAPSLMDPTPGDDWTPFIIRYQGYISMDKVLVPYPTGNLLKPVMMVAGDGDDRKPNPNSDKYRFRVDTTFHFGSGNHIDFDKDINVSHRYSCVFVNTLCSQVESAEASEAGLKLRSSTSFNTGGYAEIEVDTGIPVLPGWMAPNINSHLWYAIEPGGSGIYGNHDQMPTTEIWGGPVPGEYMPLHYSDGHVPCLFGYIPGCSVSVSVSF